VKSSHYIIAAHKYKADLLFRSTDTQQELGVLEASLKSNPAHCISDKRKLAKEGADILSKFKGNYSAKFIPLLQPIGT
jgi:hypothetical protein